MKITTITKITYYYHYEVNDVQHYCAKWKKTLVLPETRRHCAELIFSPTALPPSFSYWQRTAQCFIVISRLC